MAPVFAKRSDWVSSSDEEPSSVQTARTHRNSNRNRNKNYSDSDSDSDRDRDSDSDRDTAAHAYISEESDNPDKAAAVNWAPDLGGESSESAIESDKADQELTDDPGVYPGASLSGSEDDGTLGKGVGKDHPDKSEKLLPPISHTILRRRWLNFLRFLPTGQDEEAIQSLNWRTGKIRRFLEGRTFVCPWYEQVLARPLERLVAGHCPVTQCGLNY